MCWIAKKQPGGAMSKESRNASITTVRWQQARCRHRQTWSHCSSSNTSRGSQNPTEAASVITHSLTCVLKGRLSFKTFSEAAAQLTAAQFSSSLFFKKKRKKKSKATQPRHTRLCIYASKFSVISSPSIKFSQIRYVSEIAVLWQLAWSTQDLSRMWGKETSSVLIRPLSIHLRCSRCWDHQLQKAALGHHIIFSFFPLSLLQPKKPSTSLC